jgi:hypothetical protein
MWGIRVDHHHYFHFVNDETNVTLHAINSKLDKLMALTEQQFNEVFARIDTATNNIAARITKLEEDIKGLGLAAEVEARLLARTEGMATTLEALGKDPETVPVPEVPAEPVTPA